ncbi:MAG: (2Fe-2S) ferredoxin domain-containing protein [Erysipelotrichaceae bacterium]
MKSLDELKKMRDEARKKMDMRDSEKDYRVVVGMATCGIAAGAREVLTALMKETSEREYSCVVTQTGCIGMCTLEPIVEIFDKEGNKTTYIQVNAEKAREILHEHVKNHHIIAEYTAVVR